MKCTINDIAQELNLSRNTVSKALNGSPGVSVETQRVVLQKAREMDYKKFLIETTVPPELTVQQGTILFMTCSSVIYSEFWVSVMRGIEDVLQKEGYNLVLGVMSKEDFDSLRFPTILNDKMIRGVIAVEICSLRVCEALLKYKIPVVTVDMPVNYESFLGKMDIITMENKVHIKRLVSLLYEKGKRRFAFAGNLYSDNVGRGFYDRYDALCEALREKGLAPEEDCCIIREENECFMNFGLLKKRIEAMCSVPEVFFCGNDWTALHMMYTLQALGYQIPEHVEIIGFDNIQDGEKHDPSLTTINTPKEQLGIAAATAIISRIQNPALPFVFSQYSTDLILRDSTSVFGIGRVGTDKDTDRENG